jgi:hypothetical protein
VHGINGLRGKWDCSNSDIIDNDPKNAGAAPYLWDRSYICSRLTSWDTGSCKPQAMYNISAGHGKLRTVAQKSEDYDRIDLS